MRDEHTGAEVWHHAARHEDDMQLMDRLSPGWRKFGWEDMACPLPFHLPGNRPFKVLDLGCGLGRTVNWLHKATDYKMAGYDLPEMIERVKQHAFIDVQWFDDWSRCAEQTWDCVYAGWVFEHLHPVAIARYLRDLPAMAPLIIIHGEPINTVTQRKVAHSLGPLVAAGMKTRSELRRDTATHLFVR
jgi:trans-aconitate methyltransferase